MYLSKLELNPRSRRARQEVAHPYQMHRTVMSLFPEFEADDRDRILFRVDTNPRPGQINLLIQSDIRPDFAELISGSDYCESEPLWKEYTPVVNAGQQRYFRLRANPTIKSSGKRIGIIDEDRQEQWLNRKADLGGFRVDSFSISAEGMRKEVKRSPEVSIEISLLSVLFEGVLEVVEPKRFLETLSAGIGSGKGLGFGLLSIAPHKGE
ncbi:MAG: type I-E CRISPR-associated protein Cas6/Cse3/CasE [Chloroflexi bacterium]|nr:type I-E CRISPR-associated protein Cas6/Cse3/CasE [Chloroflexota bacterium]